MAQRRMIWCAAWLERTGQCVSRARGSGSKAVSFAGRQVHGRTSSSTSGHLSLTEAPLPCSARRRSGKGSGTRPGQASLLCADGRTQDSAREHEEADCVGRKQFPWSNSLDQRPRLHSAHSAHRATASDVRRLRPGDLVGYTKPYDNICLSRVADRVSNVTVFF
ncbi:hypothetical protein MTO96_043206 [Rhipicephalus appendiculatus]